MTGFPRTQGVSIATLRGDAKRAAPEPVARKAKKLKTTIGDDVGPKPLTDDLATVKLVRKKYNVTIKTANATVVGTVVAINATRLLVDVPLAHQIHVHQHHAVPADVPLSLFDAFRVGQTVVAKMLPNSNPEKSACQASLLPQDVNSCLVWPPVKNQLVSVCVRSVEEHGYYADLHAPRADSWKVFVRTEDKTVQPGMIRLAYIDAVKKDAKLVACRGIDEAGVRYLSATTAVDMQGLVAGQLVEAVVQSVALHEVERRKSIIPFPLKALELAFAKTLTGIVVHPHLHQAHTLAHTPTPPEGMNPMFPFRKSDAVRKIDRDAEVEGAEDDKKKKKKKSKKDDIINTKISADITETVADCQTWPRTCPEFELSTRCLARIIAVVPSSEEESGRRVVLSLLPHMVYLGETIKLPNVKMGTIFDNARVFHGHKWAGVKVFASADDTVSPIAGDVTVDPLFSKWGLHPSKCVPFHVTVENVAEKEPEVEIAKLQQGQKCSVRVLSYNCVDGQFMGAMCKSVIEEPFVHLSEVEIGAEIEASVKSVSPKKDATFSLSKAIIARAPYQQLTESATQAVDYLKPGDSHTVKVLTVDLARKEIEVTLKKSLMAVSASEAQRISRFDFKVDEIVPGYVCGASKHGFLIGSFGGMIGILYYKDVFATRSEAKVDIGTLELSSGQISKLKSDPQFRDGASLKVRVVSLKPSSNPARPKMVVLSLDLDRKSALPVKTVSGIPPLAARQSMFATLPFTASAEDLEKSVQEALKAVPVGTEISGIVREISSYSNSIRVSIWGKLRALIHATETSDHLSGRPLSHFNVGDEVQLTITGPAPQPSVTPRGQWLLLEGTMRDSDSARLPQSASDLTLNEKHTGVVSQANNKGVFVDLSSRLRIQIRCDQLGGSRVEKARAAGTLFDQIAEFYPVGTVIKNVRIINIDGNRASGSTLSRALVAAFTAATTVTYDSTSIGDKLPARFKRSIDAGCILTLENSFNIDTFCHKSEIADDPDQIPEYKPGDLVLVKVIAKDDHTRRMKVSMKPSHFTEEDISAAAEKLNATQEEEEESDAHEDDRIDTHENDSDDQVEDPSEMIMGDDDTTTAPFQMDEEDIADESDEEVDLTITSKDWLNAASDEVLVDSKDRWQQKLKSLSTRKGGKAGSAAEFEKQLQLTPDDHQTYIKYMAHLVSMSDLAKAREVAMRGIRAIELERAAERQAIWFAWLNMENNYGDTQSLHKTLSEALQFNEPKIVYLHMIDVFESTQKWAELDTLCEKMLKKCPQSVDCWIRYVTSLYVRDKDHKEIEEALKKARFRLPQERHLELDLCVARLEFKFGSHEIGLSNFQSILAAKPKRNDIWNLLFDSHLGLLRRKGASPKQVELARASFQQAATVDFKPVKMKNIFTKWLAFEKQYGTKETIKACQAQAKAYVASKSE